MREAASGAFEGGDQSGRVAGLVDEVIHACCQTTCALVVHRVGGQRDDPWTSGRRTGVDEVARDVDAVAVGHVDVEKDDVVGAAGPLPQAFPVRSR